VYSFILACGSKVLYLFCRLFFTPLGEKQPTKDENPRDV